MYNILLAGIAKGDIDNIIAPVLEICGLVVPALLTLVGAVGAIFVIFLGIKYARSDDPQEHEKAKSALKNAIIGFVLIFVLLIMLNVGLGVFQKYYEANITI